MSEIKPSQNKKFNLFDFFLILILILAGLSVYFSFFKPIVFSQMIRREGVSRYAEVDIILPDDLAWITDVMPKGEVFKNVYGQVDWLAQDFSARSFGGRDWKILKAKILLVQESSGILRYGKYTLVKGGKIFLINDHYFIEGRILDFRLLDERILI